MTGETLQVSTLLRSGRPDAARSVLDRLALGRELITRWPDEASHWLAFARLLGVPEQLQECLDALDRAPWPSTRASSMPTQVDNFLKGSRIG